MRSLRPKGAQDPQLSPWHTPVSGEVAHGPSFDAWLAKSPLPRFAEKVIKAANGEKGIVEPTFVYLPGVTGGDAIAKETGVDYFSVPVELGVRLQRAFALNAVVNYALALWSGEGHKYSPRRK